VDSLALNDKSSSPTFIVVIVEMNAYMLLLQTLPENQRDLAENQLLILQNLKHPYLCRIDEVTGSGASLSVSCEPLGSSLHMRHRNGDLTWDNEELAKQFLGVVAGLGKVHEKVAITQKLAHGRLSLEALYLDYAGKNVKIVGFGGGNNEPEQYAEVCSQLPLQYRSPEIKQGQAFDLCKADMWALGVCFLQLATHQDLTGQESIEEVASRAASLGPPLASLLGLVLTVERDRHDFLRFKTRSGYCPQCGNNINQEGLSLCEMCLQGSRSINPPASDIVSQVIWIQRHVNTSPRPPKCRYCPRDVKKINEKDICRLCLANQARAKSPPKSDPPPKPRELTSPNSAELIFGRVEVGYCIAACGELSRGFFGNQELEEGHDEFCSEKCVIKYMEFRDSGKASEEIKCMECLQSDSSKWVKLLCNHNHRFCSKDCAFNFVKRAMGPKADASLVICPKCKTLVPEELVHKWRDERGRQLM